MYEKITKNYQIIFIFSTCKSLSSVIFLLQLYYISCEIVKRFSCLCLRFQNCKGDTSDVTIPKQLLRTAAEPIVKSRRDR